MEGKEIMRFRKASSLLLAAAMAASLTACGSGTGGTSNSAAVGESGGAGEVITDTGETVISSFSNLPDGTVVSTMPWYRGDIIVYTNESTGQAKTTPDDTIILGSNQSTIVGCDPAQTMQEYVWSFNVYESLLRVNNSTGETEYWLATDITNDDNGNMHITLRDGVKFHDGNTLTAEDVLFSFKRVAESLTCPAAAAMSTINFDESYIEDDTHLVLVFDSVNGSFYSYLATAFTGIMSKDFVESVGPDYAYYEADAGSGPYQLSETIYGISQTFVAFDDYWGGKPDINTITYVSYSDTNALAIDYENGNVDGIFSAQYDTVSRVANGEMLDSVLYELPNSRYMEVIMKTTGDDAPLSDLRVRQALAHAIDYEAALITVYESEQMATYQSTSVLLPGTEYKIDVGTYEYDPEKAIELLGEAGYDKNNPCHLKIYTGSGGGGNGKDVLAEVIQGSLNRVGFDVEVEVVSSTIVTTRLNSFEVPCEYDIIIQSGNAKGGIPSAVFNSRDAYGKEYGTYSVMLGVDNEEFHNLLVEAEATTDEEIRAANYARIQEIFYENVYYLNTLPNTSYWVCRDYLQNMEFSCGITGYWATWTLAD